MTAAPVVEETTEDPVETPEYVQPADVVDKDATGEVQLFAAGFGALTLTPDQTDFTPVQRAALAAIGIDVKNDVQVEPHILPFLHLCQSRGLDPWKREAYLIGRGDKGTDKRKFTMQVGIDGYLNMAKGTGRYSRVSERLWTGREDDDASWRAVEKPNGDIVMRRVWWEAWPESREHPGQAKAVIEHYDDNGRLTETPAVANWGMYAPYFPATEWKQEQGRWKKVKVYGPDRKAVMELGEFWAKDPSGMLVKCATALAVRLAFPGATAGTYTTEEMHQADAAERIRLAAEQAERRTQAVIDLASRRPPVGETSSSEPLGLGEIIARAQASATVPPTGKAAEVVDAEVVEPEPPAAAEPDPEPEVPAWAPPDAGQAREWLLAELAVMARLVGKTVPMLTRMWVATHKRNVDDPRTTADELQALVVSFRPMVVAVMRRNPQLVEAADHYEQVDPKASGSVEWLFGGSLPDAP